MELKDVWEAISAALGDQVAEAEVVAGQGLRLQPHPKIGTEKLEVLVLPILAKIDWIVTSLKGGVLAEPRYTSAIIVPQGTELYHVADRIHRVTIKAEGLKLGTGGNTRLVRKYPPRIFLALGLDAANKFIDFQCRSTKVVFRDGKPDRGDPLRSRDEFDIWRINLDKDIKFFTDILFPGEAAWTETTFPPDCIQLVV
jgi:hypothetical protein